MSGWRLKGAHWALLLTPFFSLFPYSSFHSSSFLRLLLNTPASFQIWRSWKIEDSNPIIIPVTVIHISQNLWLQAAEMNFNKAKQKEGGSKQGLFSSSEQCKNKKIIKQYNRVCIKFPWPGCGCVWEGENLRSVSVYCLTCWINNIVYSKPQLLLPLAEELKCVYIYIYIYIYI